MEKRIEGELRTLTQVVAVDVPRHFFRLSFKREHVQFAIQTNRCNRLCLQRPNQQFSLVAQLLMHAFYEIYR